MGGTEKLKYGLCSIKKFPVVYIFCIAATFLSFNENRGFFEIDGEDLYRSSIFLLLGGIFTLNVRFMYLYNGRLFKESLLTMLGLLGLYWYSFGTSIWLVTTLFLAGSGLCFLICAPFILNRFSNEAFWRFKKSFWLGVILSKITSCVIILGISLAVFTVNYLFQTNSDYKIFFDISIFTMGFVFPLLVFSYVPTKLEYHEVKDDELPKFIIFLLKYIFLPLLLVYFAILYFYIGKIILDWHLPILKAGYFVSIFAVLGLVIYLVTYPFRSWGNFHLLFKRFFFLILLLPLGLLVIASYLQISSYGVTEYRYLLVLFWVWLTISVIYAFIKRTHIKLIVFPLTLTLLLFLASFGPWGGTSISVASQKKRLTTYLIANNILVSGKIQKTHKKVSENDSLEISSIMNYFEDEYRFKAIEPLFDPNDIIKDKQSYGCKCHYKIDVERMVTHMGVKYYTDWDVATNADNHHLAFKIDRNYSQDMLDVSGIDFYATQNIWNPNQKYSITLKGNKVLNLKFISNTNQLKLDFLGKLAEGLGNSTSAFIDLSHFINIIGNRNSRLFREKEATFRLALKNLDITIICTNLDLHKKVDAILLNHINIEIYITKKVS